jgi:hypothetical protein
LHGKGETHPLMGWVAFKLLRWRVEEPDIGFGVMLTTPSKPIWGF